MNIDDIAEIILDERSSPGELRQAMGMFVSLCADAGKVAPDASFNAWAGDSLLESGVAINPGAAAHCASDYRRSAVFIRGVHAAINELSLRFPDSTLQILYAGCGPYATLILPLLGRLLPAVIKLSLLDAHQASLDNVALLTSHFGFGDHDIEMIRNDASSYRHSVRPHLVIVETMQKALEQEPQFAVTANLAPQLCEGGVFIPERIDVSLSLANTELHVGLPGRSPGGICGESLPDIRKHHLATVCSLRPQTAFDQMQRAQSQSCDAGLQLDPTTVMIPNRSDLAQLQAAFFTKINVFGIHYLADYESQITLPLICYELSPLSAGASYRVIYELGSYPKFRVEELEDS